MLKFVNDIYDKFNSLLSNAFLGLMKLTNFCNECKIRTYSFSSFFFVTFNLENIFKTKKSEIEEVRYYIINNQNYLSSL